ncbi:MAG: L-threonylcarbamoyladenylate synthase, partial [Armatimonadota bacterium]
APSANLSGTVSPVTAGHVLADLEGKIEAVLDGGHCPLGIESTVLDLTTRPPKVLRPGAVGVDRLEEALGEVSLGEAATQRYRPRAEVILVEAEGGRSALAAVVAQAGARGGKVGLAGSTEGVGGIEADAVEVWGRRADAAGIARNLYVCLRRLDEAGVDVIVAEGLSGPGYEAAMHRLRSAARRVVAPEDVAALRGR